MDSFRSESPLDSPFSELIQRCIIKVIRRPHDYSLDDNETETPLGSRSYSVIRRVRRLQSTIPTSFTNEFATSHDNFASVIKMNFVFISKFDYLCSHQRQLLFEFVDHQRLEKW